MNAKGFSHQQWHGEQLEQPQMGVEERRYGLFLVAQRNQKEGIKIVPVYPSAARHGLAISLIKPSAGTSCLAPG
jgi:hypothetical protein